MPAPTLIVPTLCVGMHPWTLCVLKRDAERRKRHSHAERGNDHCAVCQAQQLPAANSLRIGQSGR
ncbi:hypothetical protein E1K68_04205 [Pseudomonas sp. B2021]|nr:hypothetical protein [Pseudomonas sp. B2021]